MKKKILCLWLFWVACVIATVGLWFGMNKVALKYDEVEVRVLSATTKRVKNKKNGSTYDFYEIKVEYNDKTYDLENAHDAYSYTEGKKIKAYLANDKLYANIEGVRTATPVANLYFVFLIGSFALLFFNFYAGSKLKEKEASEQIKESDNTKDESLIENSIEEKKEPN